MAGSRTRKPDGAAARRARPEDFKVRPRRTFDPVPYFVLSLALVGGAWYYYTHSLKTASADATSLQLKTSDKGIGVKSVFGIGLLEEGKPIEAGSVVSTQKAQRSVFTFGGAGSLRVSADAEFEVQAVEAEKDGHGARVKALKGRYWMVTTPQAHWYLTTPNSIIRPKGKVVEVRIAPDGGTTCLTWNGTAELEPLGHSDRKFTIPDKNEASYEANRSLTHPHPLSLAKGDPFLDWNLAETMQVEVNEKPVTPAPGK